ncbi:hypothetical protein [Nitrosophilus kaiyonis]|uniref:hypothetical protein n=1 Tax=Nitrosophilus kaiyonis TaxID=2930200 RepID=UPI0024907468|nr:hypothetical protein [Nitrosophilus kaiyonis]
MKKNIKQTINMIIETGIFNNIVSQIKLKTLKNIEKNKIPFMRKILQVYYKNYISKTTIKCNENQKRKPKIYFITNIFPLWEKSISNFLKINADIATVYLKNNIEVEFILMHHSHVSYLTNKGIKWNDILEVDHKLIENKIKNDLFNMYNIQKDKIRIHILNKQKGNIKLKDYIKNVIDFFDGLNFSNRDIFIYSGGICKSDLAEILLQKINAKKVYLTAGAKETVECQKYDYVLTYNNQLLNKYNNAIPPKNVIFSPFEWEKNSKLSPLLQEKINKLLNKKVKGIFLSSKQQYTDSIDDEFIEILNNIMAKYSEFYLVLIGDNKNKIMKKLKNKIIFNEERIICIEFVDSLYVLFRELNKYFKTLYILPRITGSGVTNLMAACAGIPTTIFKGNDADGNWIPSKYFVKTKEEYFNQINKFIKDDKKIEEFIKDFDKFKKEQQKKSKEFYLKLLS